MRFGTDGVRGRANTELTAAFALDLGRAAARVLAPSRAVVGGDSRISTPMLEAAFVAGLAAEGVEVWRLGVTPTPAVAFEAQQMGAMGAVISASHNPYYDNGIKLFAVGGTKLPDHLEAAIETELGLLAGPTAPPGVVHGRRDAEPYLAHLLSVLDGRGLESLKIVVDAANGAASHIAAELFSRTGATVITINDDPDGYNINTECGATHTAGLQAAVRAQGADLGIALDGDADRLIAVDATGAVVDGDHIIAICAIDLHQRGCLVDDTVVVTVMTNLGFRLAMEARGIRVVSTQVGDRYVLEALSEYGYSIGGEQSGHVIMPLHATTGDGMLTALFLLDVIARAGQPLSELAAAAMTQLPQVLINVPVAPQPANSVAADPTVKFADAIATAEAKLGRRGRVLLRASGTEPLIRVMVEADTADQARTVAEQLANIVKNT